MLESLLGNKTRERTLLYVFSHGEGHTRGIASSFNKGPRTFSLQLKKLEKAGILASKPSGRTKVYTFNPRYPFLKELKALLAKALEFIPQKEKQAYYTPRLRPRRSGKPL